MKLIDKDALVAEIERRRKTDKEYILSLRNLDYRLGKVDAFNGTLSFIDTLEVKEVDLEKEINLWFDYGFPNDEELLDYIKETAKHFYKLGLKVNKG